MNMTEHYAEIAGQRPEKPAIHDKLGPITYLQWQTAVSKTSRWLLKRRSKCDRRVGLFLRNHRYFLQLFTAAANIGWTAVPLDPRWNESEIRQRVHLAELSLIIAESDWAEKCAAHGVKVVALDQALAEIGVQATGVESPADAEDLPFYFGFTSGSTGLPKGFVRTQASWLQSFACNKYDLKWTGKDVILICGSLFNTHFLYAAVSGLYLGATVILLPSFSAELCLRWLEAFSCSQVAVVPTMLETIIAEGLKSTAPFHWFCSGAKCAVSTKKKIQLLFPNSLLDEYYGASELSFVALNRQEEPVPAGSAGRPFFNVSVKIRKQDGTWAENGEEGDIFVKSPLLFSHYITKSGIADVPRIGEWATVGDIGYLDRHGYLYIQGRKNGMINYGGLNIFPEEIERVLQSHPDIEHSAVAGLPNHHWGQLATAFIQLKKNKEADIRTLRSFCRGRLSGYKVPRAWFFLEKMPYTAGGKIDKRLLKEEFQEAVRWKKR